MADVIAYNGSDKWKQKATELLNQGGGGGGLVDDVKVNGTSVVDENKVAQIDLSDYATQSYVTNALDDYTTTAVLQANYYDKTEVNSRLANKADANSVYTKTETDTLLSAKANASDVYTKTETYSDDEVDALLSTKANTVDLATVATSGSYDDLTDKPTIPAAQVQSDWLESDTTAKSYILNKPTIPSAQVQSDWNEADSSAVDYIKNKPNLATVATSGDYDDLSNKPTIPAAQVQSDWLEVDTSAKSYILNKPTIPSAQVNSDWNASSGVAEILNKPNLATVATSGSYDDLTDKPTIPAAQVQSDWSEADNTKPNYIKNKPSNATQSTSGLMSSTDKTKLDGIASGAEVNVQSDWSQSDNTADDYIKNKPTIPTVNDGTLTIKNGDQTKGTFSANQSSNANVVILPFDITGNTTIGFTPVYPS